jgi:transcriptional regulator with XRE-family HTH domain
MEDHQPRALRHFRKTFQHMTQAELAAKLDISQKVWSNYETGKHRIPIEIIDRLKNIGDFKEEWLKNGIPLDDIKGEMVTISKAEYERLKRAASRKDTKADPPPKQRGPASKDARQ